MTREQISEVLDFLNSIEGAGYGGMASFEIARANVRNAASAVSVEERETTILESQAKATEGKAGTAEVNGLVRRSTAGTGLRVGEASADLPATSEFMDVTAGETAPFSTSDGQPVAWLVPSDETGFCRIWWRDKERAEAWIAKHPDCTLVPLYATPDLPQQSSVMRAAAQAAKTVEGWSDAKRDYAERVIGDLPQGMEHQGTDWFNECAKQAGKAFELHQALEQIAKAYVEAPGWAAPTPTTDLIWKMYSTARDALAGKLPAAPQTPAQDDYAALEEEAFRDYQALEAQLGELGNCAMRQKAVLDWIESWVSNPVGAYSVHALDGLFGMTRDKIAALSLSRPHEAPHE